MREWKTEYWLCRLGIHGAHYEAAVRVTRNQAQGRKEIAQMRGNSETRLILHSMWEPGMSSYDLLRLR